MSVATLASGAASAQDVSPVGAAARQAPSASGETALDEITVTSTKTEEKAIEALAGASVVSADTIRAIQPDRVSDILRQVPGVTTQEAHNDPGQAINIRGLQDFGRVNVLVDGARQNFQSTGHGANGTFYLDPELIGGIDITRGPVSTIYGSGAIGGVVSFRTRNIEDILKPDELAGVEQKLGGGSNGYGFVNSTSVGARLPNNAVSAFGQFVYRNSTASRDGGGILVPDTGSELKAGNFKLNINPADGHFLTFSALVQNFDFINNGSSLTGARFRSVVDAQTYTWGYRFAPTDNPLIDLNMKGYYTRTDDARTFVRDSANRTYGLLGARPGNQVNVDLDTVGFDIFNTSRFDTGAVSHALTYGGDGVFDDVRTRDAAGGYTSAFTPSGERRLLGAFVQNEMRYGDWLRAVGALRYDAYEIKGGAFGSSGDRISPRGTIGVSPFPWIEFFGTYAEGYRAPTLSETLISGVHPFPAFTILPNTNLRPETAHNLEGGVNLRFDNVLRDGDALRAKLVGFSNDVDNFIDSTSVPSSTLVPVAPGFPAALCRIVPRAPCAPLPSVQYNNIARAELSGVELEAAYDWGDGFASLAYTHTDGINAATRATLVTVPPDRLAGTLGFRFLDRRLTVGTRTVWYDARTNTPPNGTIPNTKEFALVDLFASYEHNDWIRADLTLSNIFDKRYIKYLDLDRSPGFQARGSLTVKFATK
ncbi:TonB-dependent hemoglobin/transferrin/lactoferrin family receptor [Enterovirga sp. CN4-39]|uniref:TonB-dependent hemoglobin/transferrin/lactoferrin family receptor n=1 Tax=Enterovirga sp. CN4-39 TaxID=3400910 RepID=UPI003C124F79